MNVTVALIVTLTLLAGLVTFTAVWSYKTFPRYKRSR